MTTLGWIVTLCCGLPLLAIVILGIVIAIWGIKTVWKIVTWPIRAVVGLFHKKSEVSPAPVAAAPVAAQPVQDDRSRNGAVTQTQNVTVNGGAGGAVLAFLAFALVIALLVVGLWIVFRPAAAPVVVSSTCTTCTAAPASTPVVVVPVQKVAGTCPTGQFVGASPKLTVHFTPGTWYHVNMSVKGNEAGVENNVLFTPKAPFTMVFDGNVYSYATLPAADCQLFVETDGDTWHKVSQLPDDLVEYAFPVGQSGTAGNEIIFSVIKDDGTVVASTVKVETGVVAQGENVSGTCVAGAWCGLSWYVAGQPEKVTLFQAKTDVVISGFNGTLSQWDHQPTAQEIGNKPAATIQEAKASGITFQGDLQ